VPPLVDGPGGVTYVGTIGQLQAAAGEAATLSSDGDQTWLRAADPANPGGTLSVFDVMDRLVTELNTPGRTGAAISQSVTTGLRDLDTVMGNLASARARAGEALVRADGIEGRLSQAKLDAQTERSKAEDLDMVAAISDFQAKQTGYDAALRTYSIVQRMSLVDYLR
jgi:flagellar hook-associated protein 3 FlgL